METMLYTHAEFAAVYLVNGAFRETIDGAAIRRDEVLFVTVLPLSAALLPYTVRLAGGRVRSNRELARALIVEGLGILLCLEPRYNYVYSPEPRPRATDCDRDPLAKRFFAAVKRGDIKTARSMMTDGLNAAVSDDALTSFFADYVDIIACDEFPKLPPSCRLLVGRDDRATPYDFRIRNDLIDDISDIAL